MTPEQQMTRDFHTRFLADNRTIPRLPKDDLVRTRCRLLTEETGEFVDAAAERDIVGMTDALADILYVVLGTANVMGIDLEPVFAEVHRSNMSKDTPGPGCGKPSKGVGFSPPDIRGELLRQGWEPGGPGPTG